MEQPFIPIQKTVNYNSSRTDNFKLEIPGAESFNYWIQSASVPGVTLAGISTDFQRKQGFVPSNHMVYDSVSWPFIVDEDWSNYLYLYDWMRTYEDMEPPFGTAIYDFTLHILNNNKNPVKRIVFIGAFPTGLSEITLSSNLSDTEVPVCNISFNYQHFEFRRTPA